MRKKGFYASWQRRGGALILASVLGLSLAGCGKAEEAEAPKKEWAYVPEFISLDEEEFSFWDMKVLGDGLYYSSYYWDEETGEGYSSVCQYSVEDKKGTPLSLNWPEDVTEGRGVNDFTIGGDGSIFVTNSVYDQEKQTSTLFVHKFDRDGNYVYGIQPKDPNGDEFWTQEMAADGQGRLYLYGNQNVYLYDEAGNSNGTLLLGTGETYVRRMAAGADGKVYVVYDTSDGTFSKTRMAEADFEGRGLGTSYENFPSSINTFTAGTEGNLLINDGSKVYEYDMGTQEKKELFDWLDCDINGSYVEAFGQLSDGRLLAMIRDWDAEQNEIALLSRVKASEVAQKENITVGTLSGGYQIRIFAVRFNKASDKYHVSVKEYLNYDNMNENSYTDAISSMINDITSSNCPDVIDLSGVNVSQLASKDAFEDLNAYLEKSSVLKRSDFMENVLGAYTYDDVLVSIPSSFTLETLGGHKSQIGDKKGWSLEEMIAYANENPDKELFDRVSKGELLQVLLLLNEGTFLNWETGECKFNSDQFKSLLEFVNRFPDEVDWAADAPVTPIRIQNGEVLLDQIHLYDFKSIQESLEMFKGDMVCIGYPTADGSGGHAFNSTTAYAIASKAKCKDGAWAFIESILAAEDGRRSSNGFPTVRSKLDAMIEEAITPQYATDENGEPYLDENGNPIINNAGGGIGWGDWFYEYHLPTQEEVDMVLEVMESAKPVNYSGNDEVLKIILEDAEPFFKGQKSADEVVGIIQNRVAIYVNENR